MSSNNLTQDVETSSSDPVLNADKGKMKIDTRKRIDLNADLGEEVGDDSAMLALVTSANIAGGGHAGGGSVLQETVLMAADYGVAIGAHPSYPDRENFGRISQRGRNLDSDKLKNSIVEQILNVAIAASGEGSSLFHVKAHGALYNDMTLYSDIAEIFLEAVFLAEDNLRDRGLLATDLDGDLPVFGLPNSVLSESCKAFGRPFIAEAFADRAYMPSGLLVPRGQVGAVHKDINIIIEQVLSIIKNGTVKSLEGSTVFLRADTLCVHGDTPGAVAITEGIRQALLGEDIIIESAIATS